MAIGQRLANLGNFDGAVTPGGVVQFNPPRKNVYNAFYFKVLNNAGAVITGANIDANILDIDMIINGDQKIKMPAKYLRAMFKARTGFDCPDGYIPVLLANDKYVSYEQKILSSWGMADVTSFQVYIHFGASLGTGAQTISSIQVYADISPIEQILGLHQCYTYQTSGVIPSGGGTLDCTTLATFGHDARLQALYVNNPYPVETDSQNYITLTDEYLEANGVIQLRQNVTPAECKIANLAFGNEVPTLLGTAFRFDSGDDIRATLGMSSVTQLRYRTSAEMHGTVPSGQVVTFIYEYLRGYVSAEQKA